jgi:hypothetical protein
MTEQNSKKEEIHWIACRASSNCEGQQAVIVFKRKAPGLNSGTSIRYRCLTCGRPFHITF